MSISINTPQPLHDIPSTLPEPQVRDVNIEIRGHTVWPIKTGKKSQLVHPYASYATVYVAARPWGHFESFSDSPKFLYYPVPCRHLSEDIEKTVAVSLSENSEASHKDFLQHLNAYMHQLNLQKLIRRWKELSKGNRNYLKSRYYLQHVQDIRFDFVTHEHLSRLYTEAQNVLSAAQTNYQNVRAEMEELRQLPIGKQGQSAGLTTQGFKELLDRTRERTNAQRNQITSVTGSPLDANSSFKALRAQVGAVQADIHAKTNDMFELYKKNVLIKAITQDDHSAVESTQEELEVKEVFRQDSIKVLDKLIKRTSEFPAELNPRSHLGLTDAPKPLKELQLQWLRHQIQSQFLHTKDKEQEAAAVQRAEEFLAELDLDIY